MILDGLFEVCGVKPDMFRAICSSGEFKICHGLSIRLQMLPNASFVTLLT
jgi:hypothetical protein